MLGDIYLIYKFMSDVDIIIPVCGNKKLVSECFESLFPVPNNWKVITYINQISDIDGTTEYLYNKQKELAFEIIYEKVNLRHGAAVEVLLDRSKSKWVLHLDSDAKLLDKKFYDWAQKVIVSEKFKVWGRVDNKEPFPALNGKAIKLLRTHSWNVLFEREYITKNNLSFSPEKLIITGIREENKSTVKDLKIWGDTSWQYYWKAARDDLFGRYPDDIWSCFSHKFHGSVDWMKENANKISTRGVPFNSTNTAVVDKIGWPNI